MGQFVRNKSPIGDLQAKKLKKKNTNKGLDQKTADQLRGILNEYSVTDMKQNPEILYVNGQQMLLIKTWEKIRHNEQCLVFHIKTLRLYNSEQKLKCEILTEQIDGNFNSTHFYDTSTLQFKNDLYFFKRLQRQESIPAEDANDSLNMSISADQSRQ